MYIETSLPFTALPISIFWLVYLFAIMVAIVGSFALFYHWKQYGFGDRNLTLIKILYTIGTIIILIFLGIAVLSLN